MPNNNNPLIDEIRTAFEQNYDAAWKKEDFYTFKNCMYNLPADDESEGAWGRMTYNRSINKDWIGFQKGWIAKSATANTNPRMATDEGVSNRLDSTPEIKAAFDIWCDTTCDEHPCDLELGFVGGYKAALSVVASKAVGGETDWEEALDSLHDSLKAGDAGGWEIELVRRRIHAALASLPPQSAPVEGDKLRTLIVAEIMKLVQPEMKPLGHKPTIAELEAMLNEENPPKININPDGSLDIAPSLTTVGDIADAIIRVLPPNHAAPVGVLNLNACPTCKGPADNGHDRCYPPNPYECTKCDAKRKAPSVGVREDE